MASGTLYTFPNNFRAYKALIAAQYSGAKLTIPADFKFGETNRDSQFLKKFPLGKVPAFESKDGVALFESNAIAAYVGNAKLNGENPQNAAEVLQWINFGDNEVLPNACTWVFPCLGLVQFNKQETEKAKQNIKKALGVLNERLLTRTYLVGDRISQADISVACNLLMLYQYVLEPAFRNDFQNVNRWFKTLINQKEFKSVIGTINLCDKMAQFDGKRIQLR
ncbi:elongation factor 1-gamma [Patella vulgata]|uniref:elongation factor 1-gamma n=1 Tax=Patella vulgata TaxID=6465 RepID=UPI0021802FBB|nr:elongation factor 1-gamma [Patella vulgata]